MGHIEDDRAARIQGSSSEIRELARYEVRPEALSRPWNSSSTGKSTPMRRSGASRLSRSIVALVIVATSAACRGTENREARAGQSDSAFAAMQARGQAVMGVDQYTSAHVFEDLPDGGRVVLDRDDGADTAGIGAIRRHMRDIAAAFQAGDFARPFQVHEEDVPGTAVMTARRTMITYEALDRPRGAEVRIRATDSAAVAAIHAFLAFQRSAHHAAGHEAMTGGVH